MTSYEILDAIADSYNPLLFLGYIVFSVVYWKRGDRLAVAKGLCGIIMAYILMLSDSEFEFWRSAGLDYSTHSAVAWSLIAFHVHKRRWNSSATIGLSMSLALYYGLELYQHYHTVLDILSTVMIVGPVVAVIYWTIGKLSHPASHGASER